MPSAASSPTVQLSTCENFTKSNLTLNHHHLNPFALTSIYYFYHLSDWLVLTSSLHIGKWCCPHLHLWRHLHYNHPSQPSPNSSTKWPPKVSGSKLRLASCWTWSSVSISSVPTHVLIVDLYTFYLNKEIFLHERMAPMLSINFVTRPSLTHPFSTPKRTFTSVLSLTRKIKSSPSVIPVSVWPRLTWSTTLVPGHKGESHLLTVTVAKGLRLLLGFHRGAQFQRRHFHDWSIWCWFLFHLPRGRMRPGHL